MIEEVTLSAYGDRLAVALPGAMTDRLKLSAGDRLYAIETDHGILLTPLEPGLLRAAQAGERISDKYQAALRELAR